MRLRRPPSPPKSHCCVVSQVFKLIVGLGNPGRDYAGHRHNIGFWYVEQLAYTHKAHWRTEGKFAAELARIEVAGQTVWLLKPQTYMNRSGQAVCRFAHYHQLPPEAMLVAHDDLDLPSGTARLKQGGGHGGHNGLRDLLACLPTPAFYRLRLGIGHPGHKDRVVGYVLGVPPAAEQAQMDAALQRAVELLPTLLAGRWQQAVNQLHAPP